ncbi:MAG TPA: hypothetical protein VGE38_08290 [Nocardioides sp.]|uniref:hypothetical protein n=1 Tax=Nocardioides sp. TaxID=35761 RepID=UPI002EDA57D0
MAGRLRTPADLADLFGGETTARKVLDWRREYGWPCVEVGRTIRFTDEQVAEILAKHTVIGEQKASAPILGGQTSRSARRAS